MRTLLIAAVLVVLGCESSVTETEPVVTETEPVVEQIGTNCTRPPMDPDPPEGRAEVIAR